MKTFPAYWYSLWFVIAIAGLGAILEPFAGYRVVGFIFLLGVLGVGTNAPLGPTLLSAAASALTWNFFFIPPKMTLSISAPEDVIMCVSYFVVATIIGYQTNRIQTQGRAIREREDRTNLLYDISQDIASSLQKADFLTKITGRVGSLLGGECGVILRDREGNLQTYRQTKYGLGINAKEQAVATWVFKSGKTAGWSTETLSDAPCLCIPLKTTGQTVGVLVYLPGTQHHLTEEQQNLLRLISKQLAIALERHFYEKSLQEAAKLEESEKLHQTLLNSISHEMRTPLTVILGTAAALSEKSSPKTEAMISNAASELTDAGERLNRVVENLLDMSRLNSGTLGLKSEWHDIHDLVGVTLKKIEKSLTNHKVTVDLPNDLPLIEMDFRFMEHALSNVLLNAATYCAPNTSIRIRGHIRSEFLQLSVEDDGPGIPRDDLTRIFEKFYRVPGTPSGGTGLGLSIVKSIVEAHDGKVFAENRESVCGTRFVIELPIKVAPEAPIGVEI